MTPDMAALHYQEARDRWAEEVRRLLALLHNEIMPRYAELYEAAGLGNSVESVVWQLIKGEGEPPPQDAVVMAALSLVNYAEGMADQTPPISGVNFVTGGHYRALVAAVKAYREAQEAADRPTPPATRSRIVHFIYGDRHVPAIVGYPHAAGEVEQLVTVFHPDLAPFSTLAREDPTATQTATWHIPEDEAPQC